MIISFNKNFIFFKTLKTSSTTLEIILSKYLNVFDIISPIDGPDEEVRIRLKYRSKQNYKFNFLEFLLKYKFQTILSLKYFIFRDYYKKKYYEGYLPPKYLKFSQHMPALEIKNKISSKHWENFFKFTILRNPIDQIISNYFYVKNNPHQFPKFINIDIDEYINSYAKNFFIRNEKIFCINNKSIVDKVLLFENLSDDLNYLAKKLNLNSNLVLEYKNIKTKYGNYNKNEKLEILNKNRLISIKNLIPKVYFDYYNLDV